MNKMRITICHPDGKADVTSDVIPRKGEYIFISRRHKYNVAGEYVSFSMRYKYKVTCVTHDYMDNVIYVEVEDTEELEDSFCSTWFNKISKEL